MPHTDARSAVIMFLNKEIKMPDAETAVGIVSTPLLGLGYHLEFVPIAAALPVKPEVM